MAAPAIKIEGLGKRFSLCHQAAEAQGLRHELQNLALAPLRMVRNFLSSKTGPENSRAKWGYTREEFWALRDINLEVAPGEVVGIIGRNGAGKSTLLKILSRITEPTTGRIEIQGSVASLLEVGTGFHPELTGRENIFLNGAILGMSSAQIRKKFDEIVAFAEIEQFLDTPVKRYSSGMYVRLAFAIAAHLESQILFIDEVLAVGDAQFQKKCLGKIRDVSSSEGRTVLFVSHSMGVVASLCSKGVLLRQGQLIKTGRVRDVLEHYNREGVRDSIELIANPSRPSITKVSVDHARLAEGDFVMEVCFSSPFALNPPIVGVVVSTPMGVPVFATDPLMHPEDFPAQRLRTGVARVWVPDLPLHPGEYRASVFIAEHGAPYDYRADVLSFDFVPRKPLAAKCSPIETIGALIVRARWELDNLEGAASVGEPATTETCSY